MDINLRLGFRLSHQLLRKVIQLKKTLIIFALSLFTIGCAMRPTEKEIATADYGSYPNDYEQIIRIHTENFLKDPESARYKFLNTPKPGWNSIGGKRFGYVICANINAKNSFGGYVGNRMSYFMIRNGRIIYTSNGDDNFGEALAQGMCKAFI